MELAQVYQSEALTLWESIVADIRQNTFLMYSVNHHFKALVDFRDWLKEIRNKPEYRQVERRNGRMQFDLLTGKHIPDPFTIQARKMILDKLCETEKEFGNQLISKQEIDIIDSTWADELLQKVSRQHLQQTVAYA